MVVVLTVKSVKITFRKNFRTYGRKFGKIAALKLLVKKFGDNELSHCVTVFHVSNCECEQSEEPASS